MSPISEPINNTRAHTIASSADFTVAITNIINDIQPGPITDECKGKAFVRMVEARIEYNQSSSALNAILRGHICRSKYGATNNVLSPEVVGFLVECAN